MPGTAATRRRSRTRSAASIPSPHSWRGRAARDLSWCGERLPAGGLLILDVYGQDHDDALWGDPYAFRPQRFTERRPGRDELVPQGGGDPVAGHRCPGEDVTVRLLAALAARLTALDYDVPPQDLAIPLSRVPARPRSGFVVDGVRRGRP